MQTYFLALDFTGITGDKSCFAKSGSKTFVVLQQRPRDPMAYGTRLPGIAAAFDVGSDVDLVDHFCHV